jgi:hypothetical protein
MTEDELIAEYGALSVDNVQAQNAFAREMLKREVAGTLDPGRIREAKRAKWMAEWLQLKAWWEEGVLLECQGYGFRDFLGARTASRRSDIEKVYKLFFVADMVGETESELHAAVAEIQRVRVLPHISWRREFFDDAGNLMAPGDMTKGKRDDYEVWKERWDDSAKKGGWRNGEL